MSILKKVFFTLLPICFVSSVFAQVVNDSLVTNDKLKLLKTYNDQAIELYNSFKNGPAFEQLQNYGVLKEKNFNEQKDAELNQLDESFKTEYSAHQNKLTEIQKSIALLKLENDSLLKEKQKLRRNTILFFVVLATSFLAVLYVRKRSSKQWIALADASAIQLNRASQLSEISGIVNSSKADLEFAFRSVFDLSAKAIPAISKLKSAAVNQKKNFPGLSKIEESMNRIHAETESALSSMKRVGQNSGELQEEKIMSNLNELIDEVFDVSYNWIKSIDASFECSKVKDLEKILPEINIMPNAIRVAMFHFMNNAFYAVYEKKKSAGKGYESKVSVSSRKLPRFVQVRIKDNGFGIDDKNVNKIYEPFYSAKPPEIANGLGLTQAAAIIKKKHGGEIIIESEPRNGTDFIIRFPLNTLM